MGKIFAVAMVFKRPINNNAQTEENLLLHIVSDCETKGDAYLKAYDLQKNAMKDAGCYSKVVLEVPQEDGISKAAKGFAEWASEHYNFREGKWVDKEGNYNTSEQLYSIWGKSTC